MPKIGEINKELKALIKQKQEGLTELKELRKAKQEAQKEINNKYGHGWRLGSNNSKCAPHDDPTSPYYGHVNGEHWMD